MARTRLYRNGVLEKENFPIADISECVNDPGAVVWLDICTLDDDAGLDDSRRSSGCMPSPSRTPRMNGSARNSTTTARTCS
jgi:hypothetical protein